MSCQDDVYRYYNTERDTDDGTVRSIYQIWETGSAYRDSVTPSTWCATYRIWITNKIETLLGYDSRKRVLSLGCGNAFVEAALTRAGYKVFAIDINDEAVQLARAKGVAAECADFFVFELGERAPFDLIYADGLFGHLYDKKDGCKLIFRKIHRLAHPRVGRVLISNDAPSAPIPYQMHPCVSGFWYLDADYLAQEALESSFLPEFKVSFPYSRPISGPTRRSIVVAAVASAGRNN